MSVAFYSRTLSDHEKNNAQIHNESLAVITGLKKFHQYIWGRHFTILTDHKPLLGQLGSDQDVPQMISPRIQQWVLTMWAYEYDLVYRPGPSILHADVLSHLPLPTCPARVPVPGDIYYVVQHLDAMQITTADICCGTSHDSLLLQVYRWVQEGFPESMDDEDLKPYFSRRHELASMTGVYGGDLGSWSLHPASLWYYRTSTTGIQE